MKKLWKWAISAWLCLAMLVSVLSVTAFAAEGSATSDAGAVLSKLLKSSVYVEKNKKAGLRGDVNVALDLPNAGGVVYLPGSADAKKLRLAWDAKDVTFSRGGKTYKSGKAPIAPAGKTYKYKVSKGSLSAILKVKTVQGSSDVDAMFLEIDESKGSILAMQLDSDHLTSCYGKMKVGDHKKKYVSIKGRGSSTWLMPKKPYNMTIYDDETYTSKDKTELIDGVKV
ncbi:MAG: hypothetical protein IKX83_04660, partial [Clostridia bacterium]|nr:hypothetical protein [Clostridia bacterium]